MGEEILRLENIVKEFPGVKALDGVSLQLCAGECHALIGENGAGKSTLMKIVSGLYKPTSGKIFYNGEEITIKNEKHAIDLGIAIVAQELNPIPVLSIADNIFMGRYPDGKAPGFIDEKKINAITQQYLDEFQLPFKPTTKLSKLSVSNMQMIEIIKALDRKAKIIILDEPSSAITDKEVDILFGHIKRLQEKGISVVYISHKMDEIFKIADRITVIRDGHWVSTKMARETNIDSVIAEMVGRQMGDYIQRGERNITNEEALRVEHFSHNTLFKDVSFRVNRGEILGIAGLMGAGRTEVVSGLFGMYDKNSVSGDIFLYGEKINIGMPRDAIQKGIVMISEDRRNVGIIPRMSIRHNIGLPNMDIFAKHFFVNTAMEANEAEKTSKRMRVKANNIDVLVSKLSGGNQQKVVLAKWLVRNIKVLIMDEPTRGIDVGAKNEIYHIMSELAKEGMAIIMISSELPEVIGMSDRVVVMAEGRVAGELSGDQITQENIMRMAV